jgi:H+-transporting ATPase
MKNYAVYRLGETIRILLFLTLSIIAFNFFPVTAIMIVLLALLNDIPIMTIAFDRVQHSKTPQRWNIKNILIASAVLGAIGVVESFLLLYIGRDVFVLPAESIQTLIYLKLSVAGHMFLFVARTRKNFWTVRPSLPLFLAVCVTQLVATIIAVYGLIIPAIGWNLALFVWGYSFLWFLVTDFGKILLYKFIRI